MNEIIKCLYEKNVKVSLASKEDEEQILCIYKSLLYGPADWNENYPNEENIAFDITNDALFVMKNDEDEVVAACSIDKDEDVDNLSCWNKELLPAIELSRICVRKDMQHQGLATLLIRYMIEVVMKNKAKSVRMLVRNGHKIALKTYKNLGFTEVGNCYLFERDFICLERKI